VWCSDCSRWHGNPPDWVEWQPFNDNAPGFTFADRDNHRPANYMGRADDDVVVPPFGRALTYAALEESDVFAIESGSTGCKLSGNGQCVRTSNYGSGSKYDNNERCVVMAKQSISVSATFFDVEPSYDKVRLPLGGTTFFTGSTGPVDVPLNAGERFEWTSDGSVTRQGFEICKNAASPAPDPPEPSPPPPSPLPPTPPPASDWFAIIDGEGVCTHSNGGLCVTTGEGNYDNNGRCEIKALKPMVVTATSFDTETNYDQMRINGRVYTGADGPTDVALAKDSVIVWTSDSSVTRSGFTLCKTTASPPPPPPPPPLPGYPSDAFNSVCIWELSSNTGRALYGINHRKLDEDKYVFKLDEGLKQQGGSNHDDGELGQHARRQLRGKGCRKYKRCATRGTRAPPKRP